MIMIIYNVGNEYNDVDRVVHHIIYHYSCNNLVHYLHNFPSKEYFHLSYIIV